MSEKENTRQDPVKFKAPLSIMDGHVHIFPEKMMKAVFSYFAKQYGWQLPFSPNPDSLLKRLEATGAAGAFALAYTHRPGLSRSLNRWLAGFCSDNPQLIPFGSVHPFDPDLQEVVEEGLDCYRFAGMKLHCLVQKCRPDDPLLFPLYAAVTERSRGMVIHAGSFPQPAAAHLGIDYVANLLKNFPRLKLIVPHLGLNDLTGYARLLERHEELYLDTAFVFQNRIVSTPLTEIKAMIRAYPERIIYGSDFPFILEPPENGIRRIIELDLPPEVYPKIFNENANRFISAVNRGLQV